MKNELSVGIFIDGDFIPSYDGATNRMHYLSRYLQKMRVKVTIFHGYRGWTDLRLVAREPFKTYLFPIDRYYYDINFLVTLVKAEGIRIIQFDDLESIISKGIELSHATEAYIVSEAHYVVSRLAKSIGVSTKRIHSIKQLEAAAGRAVDHVICLSGDDKPELQNKMGIPTNRISVVPSGVDLEEIKYGGPNFDAKTVLFLGNLYFEPNADAVRLMHRYILPPLRRRGFKFLIVGDCPQKIRRRYQSPHFQFSGPIRDLNNVFRKATIALAPIRESTGLRIKILNYLAAGLPVIATSTAASGLRSKKCLIIEDDLTEYAEIILDLVTHRDRVLRISRASRRFVEQHFDWRAVACQTASVYRKILSRPLKDKSPFRNLASKLNVGQPAWLEEAERKGRFAKLRPAIRGSFSYGVINEGEIRVVK